MISSFQSSTHISPYISRTVEHNNTLLLPRIRFIMVRSHIRSKSGLLSTLHVKKKIWDDCKAGRWWEVGRRRPFPDSQLVTGNTCPMAGADNNERFDSEKSNLEHIAQSMGYVAYGNFTKPFTSG